MFFYAFGIKGIGRRTRPDHQYIVGQIKGRRLLGGINAVIGHPVSAGDRSGIWIDVGHGRVQVRDAIRQVPAPHESHSIPDRQGFVRRDVPYGDRHGPRCDRPRAHGRQERREQKVIARRNDRYVVPVAIDVLQDTHAGPTRTQNNKILLLLFVVVVVVVVIVVVVVGCGGRYQRIRGSERIHITEYAMGITSTPVGIFEMGK